MQAAKTNALTELSALWARVSVSDWLRVLTIYSPNNRWHRKGSSIKGRCLWHPDQKPSLYVTPQKGLVKCFSCGKATSDPLYFLTELTGKSKSGAISDIISGEFGLRFTRTLDKEERVRTILQRTKKTVHQALNALLVNAATDYYEEEYAYCRPAIRLLASRGIYLSPDRLQSLPIGIFPTKFHLKQHIPNNKNFEDAIELLGSKYFGLDPFEEHYPTGGVTFTYYTSFEDIGGIKIRLAKKKEFLWTACNNNEPRGLFGLQGCNFAVIPQEILDEERKANPYSIQTNKAFIVEGEFDCLQLHSLHPIRKTHAFMAASGGGIDDNLSYLKSCGFQSINILPDNDSGGVSFSATVLSSTAASAAVFDWTTTPFPEGSDPDDLVRGGHGHQLLQFLSSDSNWLARPDWFVEAVSAKREESKLNPIIGVSDSEYDEQAVKAYIDSVHESALSAEVRHTLVDQLTKQGFNRSIVARIFAEARKDASIVEAVRCALAPYVLPLFVNPRGETVFYSVKRNELFELNLETARDATVGYTLTKYLIDPDSGGTLLSWCEEYVGLPKDFTHNAKKTGDGDTYYIRKDDKEIYSRLFFYLRNSLVHLSAQISKESVVSRGQGVHYFGHLRKHRNLARAVYVVNGKNVYKASLSAQNYDKRLTYEWLGCPFDDGIVFNTEDAEWSEIIEDLDSLNQPVEDWDFGRLHKALYDFLNIGWAFGDKSTPAGKAVHHLECVYLAAWIICASVGSLFKHRNQTYITAEHHSGKTTLLEDLLSEGSFGILEQAMYYSEFSAAGIMQDIQGRTPALLIDEFEARSFSGANAKRAKHTSAILESFRQNYKGYTKSVRGTQEQRAVKREASAFCLFAGIHPPMEDGADVSRWILVSLFREAGRQDSPCDVVLSNFGPNFVDQVRSVLTRLPLQYAHKVIDSQKFVHDNWMNFGVPVGAPASRYTALMSPIYGVMSLFMSEEEVLAFSRNYASVKTVSLKPVQDSSQILDDILSTRLPDVHGGYEDHPTSIGRYLRTMSTCDLLNTRQIGVYYHKDLDAVVMFLPHVLNNILRGHPSYRSTSRNYAILQRKLLDEGAWTTDTAVKKGIVKWLKLQMNQRIATNCVVVFDRSFITVNDEVDVDTFTDNVERAKKEAQDVDNEDTISDNVDEVIVVAEAPATNDYSELQTELDVLASLAADYDF